MRSSIGIGLSASSMPVRGTMACATTNASAAGIAAPAGASRKIAKPSAVGAPRIA